MGSSSSPLRNELFISVCVHYCGVGTVGGGGGGRLKGLVRRPRVVSLSRSDSLQSKVGPSLFGGPRGEITSHILLNQQIAKGELRAPDPVVQFNSQNCRLIIQATVCKSVIVIYNIG